MKKWPVITKIWFGMQILLQWIMTIEYATKPITRYNTAYQQATVTYAIIASFGTALIVWLMIKKSKAALWTILSLAGINAVVNLIATGVSSALLSLIVPGITWLLTRNTVN